MLSIHRVPAFNDNYLWLFHTKGSRLAYAVDPGDARPIVEALEKLDLQLNGILLTHHHPDHIGGVNALVEQFSPPVYGPRSSYIPQVSEVLSDGDKIELPQCLSLDVMEVPGHTLDHIAYYTPSSELYDKPILFCGDTLFAGGCGRLFEGSPEQMWSSLLKLSALETDTEVYCAHEYTVANLEFATAVEPDNTELQQRLAQSQQMRAKDQATVPSTLAMELKTNPFLRCTEQSVIASANQFSGQSLHQPVEVFACIRQWKDNF